MNETSKCRSVLLSNLSKKILLKRLIVCSLPFTATCANHGKTFKLSPKLFRMSRKSFLQTDQQLDCALDLMRRLPPQQIEKNLSDLIDLVPDLCEDLLSSIDQPLKVATDKKVGKDYLLCDYNRDGDSYR